MRSGFRYAVKYVLPRMLLGPVFHFLHYCDTLKVCMASCHPDHWVTYMITATTTYTFYRAMHFSANARSWDRMSSVCPFVTLVDCDHIGWKSWKLIARTISPTPSLFVAKERSTYCQGNMGKFGGD